jgi:hypothetical protein
MKKGAFVQLVSPLSGQMPNVIVFQFNPETMRHSWTQPAPAAAAASGAAGASGSNPLATGGTPGETFSFSLSMDATDQGVPAPGGLYSRLSALEVLFHPVAIQDLAGGGGRATPAAELPAVLFVWGAARILPVRLTSLTITEKLYDADLNPIHADAQLELKVLTPEELASAGALGAIGISAYTHTHALRVAGAAANLGGAARDVIGMVADAGVLP